MSDVEKIIAEIVAEAKQDSCGQPKDPAEYRQYTNAWHNNAQRDFIYNRAMALAVAVLAEDSLPPEPINIWPPADFTEGPYQWHVIVDMRQDDSTANYEWSDAVKAKAREAGLDIEADPETSCSYFYCRNEADAKKVKEIVQQVWAEGL